MNEKNGILHKYHKVKYFILCGGKCGGSTLRNSVIVNINCAHFHGNNVIGLKNVYKDLNHDINNKLINVYEMINYNKDYHNKVFVIDCYRNPIERSISAFFQNITIHVPNFRDLSVQQLINIFNEKYIKGENYHPINDMMFNFGIRNFNNFNFNEKYNIANYKNIYFVKIRFNDIDSWNKILSNVLNREITIKDENLTNNKNISMLYKEFKNEYKIPRKLLDEFINDTEFNIYNTEEEKKNYYKYWVMRAV